MMKDIGTFLLFPIYLIGYFLGMVFEAFWFGFGHGRKKLDEE